VTSRTLPVIVRPQPDMFSCGPTALHAVYRYYGEELRLEDVIAEAPTLEEGGTLAVLLGSHALRRGYSAILYSFNLMLLDPTWFANGRPAVDVATKLRAQTSVKRDKKRRTASAAYAEFLQLGGDLRMQDITPELLRRYFDRGRPILAGVSATYLYNCARELDNGDYDDLRGEPSGHFVVLTGARDGEVQVADPWHPDVSDVRKSVAPQSETSTGRYYWVPMRRLLHGVLLGVLTYDGNLLVIEPSEHAETRKMRRKDKVGEE
jgi:hypothetical protein